MIGQVLYRTRAGVEAPGFGDWGDADFALLASQGSRNVVIWICGQDVRYFSNGRQIDPDLVPRWYYASQGQGIGITHSRPEQGHVRVIARLWSALDLTFRSRTGPVASVYERIKARILETRPRH